MYAFAKAADHLTREELFVGLIFSDLSLNVVIFSFSKATILIRLNIFQFFVEFLLHIISQLDLLSILGKGQGDSFELIFSYNSGLVDFAPQKLRGLVSEN